MLSQVEAHRLAAAINQLRPDWPLASLSTWIRKHLGERAYRDAAVALTWVATDPTTTTPARVLEAGPWWKAAVADNGTLSAITHRCPEHPAEKAWSCRECEEQAADAATGVATLRDALAKAPRPKAATRPEPKPRDLDTVRARADQEAQQ